MTFGTTTCNRRTFCKAFVLLCYYARYIEVVHRRPIFKGLAAQKPLTLEEGTDMLSRNSAKQLPTQAA